MEAYSAMKPLTYHAFFAKGTHKRV